MRKERGFDMTVVVRDVMIERANRASERQFKEWERASRFPFGRYMGPPPPDYPVEMFRIAPMHEGDLFGPYPSPRDPREPIDRMTEGDLYA